MIYEKYEKVMRRMIDDLKAVCMQDYPIRCRKKK